MKRILVFIAFLLIFSDSFTAFAQRTTSSAMVVTRTKIKKAKEPVEIKWQNNIDALIGPGNVSNYSMTYTGGWRFGNFLFLGFGSGAFVWSNVIPSEEEALAEAIIDAEENYTYYNPSRISVPVFANMRMRFLKTKVSPFIGVSGGLLFQGDGVGVEAPYFVELSIGLDLRLKNSSYVSVSLTPIWSGQDDYLIPSEEPGLTYGGIKIGYSF